MDRLGDQLLPRARLALDEDGRVGRGDPADHLVDLLHRRRAPDHELVPLLELAAQPLELVGQAAELQGPGDERGDLLQVEGLGQVVVGPALRRLDRVRHRVLRRHDDEEGVDILLARPAEDVESGQVRHLDVE